MVFSGTWKDGPITIDFLEKGATVNSTYYSQLRRQNSPYWMTLIYIYIHIYIYIYIYVYVCMYI